ncbi:hypothetical protein [Spirosoma flavum]|uniref:Uncharacterized protein n=1 Tax=Spirosoma flavum TaxID=2048557 RepID=A0ABW6AHQ6_9BACT
MQSQQSSHSTKSNPEKKGRRGSAELPAMHGHLHSLKKEEEEEEDLKSKLNPLNSGEVLTLLAKPRVFKGPEVKIQDEIVRGLETQINMLGVEEQKLYAANTCVGGIEFTTSPYSDLKDLITGAKLIDLDGNCIGKSSFNLAKAAGVEKQIITNTLATMEAAGQLDYLRKSGLIGEDWKVIVEVHYYRDRDKGQTKFHKDTNGQTLFVNLNFVNDEPVPGPEFIINPGSNERYDKYISEHMPPVFVEDVQKAKLAHGTPTEIGMTVIPVKGVVAFVDETMHHKTPTLGHRTANSGAISMALSKKCPVEYKNVKEGYEKYKKRWTELWEFTGYIDKKYHKNADVWFALLTKLDDSNAKFNRKELKDILPKADSLDIDTLIEELVEQGGSHDFGEASFYFAKATKVPVKRPGQLPLQRQMSRALLTDTAPKAVPGKRTFFRTWVRAVKIN